MTLDEIEELTELQLIREMAAVTKSESWGGEPAGSYLVVEDPQKPTTWHLAYKKHGKVDRGLCGAAYAALTSNHRGKGYAGPGRSAALSKLRGIYKAQGWPLPGEKNMTFFSELTLSNMSRPFDGMAVGRFKTAAGPVTIEPDELDQYLQNTKDVLESTRGESGEIVGLPIDMDGHDHKGGAGWIVDVVRDGDLLRFVPKWTEAGQDLIRNGVRRFFSPSFDAEQKVIIGGSMTNYPASRDEKRRIKLRPVELSESLFVSEDEGGLLSELSQILENFKTLFSTLSQAKPESEEDPVRENNGTTQKGGSMPTNPLAELAANAGTAEGLAQLEQYLSDQANAKVTELLEKQRSKQHLSELADTLVGGSQEHPRGLPVEKDKLIEFMASLTPEQAKQAETLFTALQEKGFVEFDEQGHSQELKQHAKLPGWADALLRSHLDDGGTVEEFFSVNQEDLGKQESYDLSMYPKKEKE